MPQHRVDAQHAHRAGKERDVPRREELPLRRKLREHPRRGVNEERADQGDVFKDREHLMGNIDLYVGDGLDARISELFRER